MAWGVATKTGPGFLLLSTAATAIPFLVAKSVVVVASFVFLWQPTVFGQVTCLVTIIALAGLLSVALVALIAIVHVASTRDSFYIM